MRGRDIKKYGYDFADLWLINTHNGVRQKGITRIKIEDYPAIKGHLDLYYDKLEIRADQGDTPYNLRNCAYMDVLFCRLQLSNKLFLDYAPVGSDNDYINQEHCGIFKISQKEKDEYLQKYNPVQLRYDRRVKVNQDYRVMNFGDSKGLTFDRVLIYPTKDFCKWLKNNDTILNEESCSKFYVALTRAKYSVAIVIG